MLLRVHVRTLSAGCVHPGWWLQLYTCQILVGRLGLVICRSIILIMGGDTMQASVTALQWLQLQLSYSHLCGRTYPHQTIMLIQPTKHHVYC